MSYTHLIALMDGLEIPTPEWWIGQPPECIRMLGKAIAAQAKLHKDIVEARGVVENVENSTKLDE